MTNQEAAKILGQYDVSDIHFYTTDGKEIPFDKWSDAIEMAIKALEAQEWVPCKERLPEVGRSVLFSRRSMCTREGCLQADGKWWQYWWYELLNADQVTAWKPMPEPYREEDTDVNVKS